jgi:hypothetical protein
MRDVAFSYLIDAKRPLLTELTKEPAWDLFISAYNDSQRVRQIFADVPADRKVWWLIPEYDYKDEEVFASAEVIRSRELNEAELIPQCLANIGVDEGKVGRICVDITGFMRPHILFFLKHFKKLWINKFDMLYTEP